MPYRRLPTTDQARLKALQTAIQRASEADFTEQVLSYKLQNEAQRFLVQYEAQVQQYHQNFNTTVSANKKYKHVVANARMYISHFIQVLNLAVIRGDIKKEQKELYQLDVNSHILPDLSSEEDLIVWGQNIIDGEQERVKQGGFAIYNPTISKVKVHYEIFKEQHQNQLIRRKNTGKNQEDLGAYREKADAIILDIWNQVEAFYQDKLPYDRYRHCQEYGIVYYYRTGEKHLSPETDKQILANRAQQPTLPLE